MPPKKYKAPRAAVDPAVPKVRKPRAPKRRHVGLTHAEWKVDVDRRQVVSSERAKRGMAKKKRDASAKEQASRAVMANDRQQPRPPHASQYAQCVWAASQQSVVSPASFSPPVWAYYADGDALGGFNPNTAFQARPRIHHRPMRSTRIRPARPSTGSSSAPQFSTTDADINDMITAGSAAAAASTRFYVDAQDPDADTEHAEQGEDEEDVEEVEAPDPSVAGKKRKRASSGRRRRTSAWPNPGRRLALTRSPARTRTPITSGGVSRRRSKNGSWSTPILPDSTRIAARRPWPTTGRSSSRRATSGTTSRRKSPLAQRAAPTSSVRYDIFSPTSPFAVSFADDCISPLQMVRMFEMYRNDNEQGDFKFLHVFTRIESCEKWIDCRTALAKNKEDQRRGEKRNNDLAILMGADTAAMDPLVHAWFMAERAIILNQMPVQAANADGSSASNDEDPAPTEEDPADDTAHTTGSASPTDASP
ncbi:unnamed protein product [Alopecurus aequalis]